MNANSPLDSELESYRATFDCYVSIRPNLRFCPKTQETETAWPLLITHAIAFVPTKLRAWLTKGGERNALDDFCNSVGPVVTGRGE